MRYILHILITLIETVFKDLGFGAEKDDEEGGVMEVSVSYSLTLNKVYDRFEVLERRVDLSYLGQTSRSLMENNESSWLRNNITKRKKLLEVQVMIMKNNK